MIHRAGLIAKTAAQLACKYKQINANVYYFCDNKGFMDREYHTNNNNGNKDKANVHQ